MKKIKFRLYLLVSFLFLSLLLVACGNSDNDATTVDINLTGWPIVDEPITLTMMGPGTGLASWEVEDDDITAKELDSIEVDICENLDLTPILNALERYGDGVAIYFENLTTGCTFRHNAEQVFYGASITKAPFALWLYTKAEQGIVNLDMTMYFTEANMLWGSGIIRHNYEFGHEFTLREVIGLNLYESDNTATQMLRHAFGYTGYAEFIAELGGTYDFAGNILYSRVTADEVGFFAREIFAYIESNQRYSEEFKRNLLNNQFPFIVSDYPVASKTGWYRDFGGAWHDMAIVYAPSPYILVILSSERTGTEEDHAAYQYISFAFQEFNQVNFDFVQE